MRFTSGISYHTLRLANALAETHDVSVILLRDLVPRCLYPGSRRVGHSVSALQFTPSVTVFDGLDWHLGRSLLRARRFLGQIAPDVLIVQWWTSAVLHTELLLRLLNELGPKARTVIEFHEVLDPFEMRNSVLRRYAHAMRGAMFGRADAYVAHSQHEASNIRRVYGLGARSWYVVPLAASLEKLGDRRMRGPSDDFNYLFFGLIRPYKGVEYLVRAFDGLPDTVVSASRLTIVGETWEGHSLPLDLVVRSPHRDRIDVCNWYASDAEVRAQFARADAAVFPYVRASQSAAAHLAMACGLPIVASSVGGLHEVLEEYDGAMFARPGDVRELRDRLVAVRSLRNRRFDDPYSWARTRAGYERVLAPMATSVALES